MAQLIISAVGPDRPGIVGELTGHLHSIGGNILDSRMVNFRGEFALMVLLELPDASAAQLTKDLPNLGKSMRLNLSATPQGERPPAVAGLRYRLKTYSMDQPGILAKLTNLLRTHGVNIEDLVAHQESAAFAGSPLFTTVIQMTIPSSVPLRKLREELEAICNDLNCDVDLEPADA